MENRELLAITISFLLDTGPRDGSTSDKDLTFLGQAPKNSLVTLHEQTLGEIGTSVANSNNTWGVNYSLLNDGDYVFYASAVDALGNSLGNSPNLPVTIDTVAPTATAIPDQFVNENTAWSFDIAVGDAGTPAAALRVSAADPTSAFASATVTGTGSTRTLTVYPFTNQTPSAPITCTVTDGAGIFYKQTFNLTVLPVNDPPTSVQLAYAPSGFPENAPGAIVGQVSASDPDAGDTLTYSVDDPRFEVVGNTLKLKPDQQLDYESILHEPAIQVRITATDKGGLSAISAPYYIAPNDVNEPPTDILLSGPQTVPENVSNGAVIGALTVVDPDIVGVGWTWFLSDDRFQVQNGSLVLRSFVTLDFEATQTIPITLRARDSGQSELLVERTFVLTVLDRNDAPTDLFLSNASFPENTPGAVVGILSAVDPDANEHFNYGVSASGFEVVDGVLKLQSSVEFNRENFVPPMFTVGVTATDSGGASISKNFLLTILNVNEYPFIHTSSTCLVTENVAAAAACSFTVGDADGDTGLTYTVSDARFIMDGPTLRVAPGQVVDYEAGARIPVRVTVTDPGGLSAFQDVVVLVNNQDEPPTELTLSNSTIAENAAGGVIGDVSANDPDSIVFFTVSDARFEVAANQLRLKSGIALNYEVESAIELAITGTSFGKSISRSFTIQVTNVNEAPTSNFVASNVPENEFGALAGSITVSDPDAGDTISYSVGDDRFLIDGDQLRLRSEVSLDYEQGASIQVPITVTDTGGLATTQNVVVQVENRNEAPTDVLLSNAAVREDEAGAVVGLLTAIDPDAEALFAWQVNDDRFEVAGNSLRLKADFAVNYEEQATIDLGITVRDAAGLSLTKALVLQVENLNETPDNILLSSTGVRENDAGAVVGQLTATDPDGDSTFSWQVDDPRFEIVDGTLRLRMPESLNFEAGASVPIRLTVTDAGGLSYTKAMALQVADANEAPQSIGISSTFIFSGISGAWIGRLNVADPDSGDSHLWRVSDARFAIKDQMLYLQPDAALAASDEPIVLELVATDRGGLNVSRTFEFDLVEPPEAWENPHQSPFRAEDVNGDGIVSAIDALLLINELNSMGPETLTEAIAGTLPAPYLDVSGDGHLTPLDALLVINALNAAGDSPGGESPSDTWVMRAAWHFNDWWRVDEAS